MNKFITVSLIKYTMGNLDSIVSFALQFHNLLYCVQLWTKLYQKLCPMWRYQGASDGLLNCNAILAAGL